MGKIIWIASYPKSGNTWMRAFLHNFLRDPDEPYDINRLNDLTAFECLAPLYREYDDRPATEYSPADVQRLRPLVHRDLTQAFPDYVFVKTHNARIEDLGVPLVTPEVTAAAIYIVRDPRDIAVSYSHHLGLTLDRTIAFMADPAAAVGGNADQVYERLGGWSTHVRSWAARSDPTVLVLRYEDMLARPETAFGRVIRFLGLDPPPARLDKAIRFSAFDALKAQEERHGFIERTAEAAAFFRQGQAGGWRDVLSAGQAGRLRREHGGEMARFGYR